MTVDIPGAFMQGEQDETVHMKLEGPLAELRAKCDPTKYQPYLILEKGKPVLYVELVKALFGTIRAALIFWRKFTKQLIEWGFTVNPYDWCVANNQVQGSQLTITWHDTFLSMFRLCSCGTKPQRSENHHFVMMSSWEPQCHHDIIMRTPRITGKPKFSWSGGL